jgi:hypothetical protein
MALRCKHDKRYSFIQVLRVWPVKRSTVLAYKALPLTLLKLLLTLQCVVTVYGAPLNTAAKATRK